MVMLKKNTALLFDVDCTNWAGFIWRRYLSGYHSRWLTVLTIYLINLI